MKSYTSDYKAILFFFLLISLFWDLQAINGISVGGGICKEKNSFSWLLFFIFFNSIVERGKNKLLNKKIKHHKKIFCQRNISSSQGVGNL